MKKSTPTYNKIQKAFKYRIYPTEKQKNEIENMFGCSRYVYNHYLEKRKNTYEILKETLNYTKCSKDLTELKKEHEWLQKPDKFALQNSLRDLETAYANFFRRIKNSKNTEPGYPKFKSKHDNHQSYRTNYTNNNIEIKNGKIKLPKIGWIKFKEDRILDGKILNATVSRTPTGKYFVSICCKDCLVKQRSSGGGIIGVDLGLKDYIITSEGETVDNPRYYRKIEKRLVREQRKLSRKEIGSNNRNKQRLKVARVHEKISDCRKDHLHKLSSRLVNENQVICFEDLNVDGLKRNKKLSKNVSDAGWSEFVRMVEYKSDWYGGVVQRVGRFYSSSQLCSVCGFKNPLVRNLKVREWECPECKSFHNRDFNASVNIRNEGLRILGLNTVGMTGIYACGDCVRPIEFNRLRSAKQETYDFSRG